MRATPHAAQASSRAKNRAAGRTSSAPTLCKQPQLYRSTSLQPQSAQRLPYFPHFSEHRANRHSRSIPIIPVRGFSMASCLPHHIPKTLCMFLPTTIQRLPSSSHPNHVSHRCPHAFKTAHAVARTPSRYATPLRLRH